MAPHELGAQTSGVVGSKRSGRARPRTRTYTVTGWFGLVGPAVAAMAITMVANGDPNASTGTALFMSLLGLSFLALSLVVYRPLLRHRDG